MNHERRQRLAEVIAVELQRQAEGGVAGSGARLHAAKAPIDIDALAEVIDRLLEGGGAPGEVPTEGPTPAELNSSNDG